MGSSNNVTKPAIDVLGNLRRMVHLLNRMAGGRIEIERDVIYENNRHYNLDGAVHVRFINRGQSPVLLDDQEVLLPGEAFIEGDTAGPGLKHSYSIRFIDELPEKAPLPAPETANPPFEQPGNYLDVRIMRRKI
ncbi:hypothetical protein [Lewinella sp. W8]|uniref:hypothetical protein n=1 Tax=Lewinella sp. W8 TaxID=2528208 RepID=UPI0010679AAC|nr:hypothetical protein [Lewinella sp. W8]MTB53894.1 hypothetical protein [Lewinella sp. W8]